MGDVLGRRRQGLEHGHGRTLYVHMYICTVCRAGGMGDRQGRAPFSFRVPCAGRQTSVQEDVILANVFGLNVGVCRTFLAKGLSHVIS